MGFYYKVFIIIILIYLIHMKLHGKEPEFVKKTFKFNRLYEAEN